MTHLVYTHHHSDHAGGSSIFGTDVVRIGHEENAGGSCCGTTTRPSRRRKRHLPTAAPCRSAANASSWRAGGNHSPDNIYIHFPDHDTLMLVDIALPGWVPFYDINLSEDVPGYMAAPATALSCH